MIFISALDDFALSVSARYAAGKCLFHYLEWLLSLLSFFIFFIFVFKGFSMTVTVRYGLGKRFVLLFGIAILTIMIFSTLYLSLIHISEPTRRS